MNRPTAERTLRNTRAFPPATLAGFVLAVLALAAIALVTARAASAQRGAGERVTRTMTTVQQVEALMSVIKDAETGQRGFLLTGQERYLAPYEDARAVLPSRFAALAGRLEADDQRPRLEELQRLATEKLDELAATITLGAPASSTKRAPSS